MTARSTLARLVVVLALVPAGCGGSDKPAPAKEPQAPAEEGAPPASTHTPESCMLKAGLESVEKRAKTWTAFHPDGYAIRVKKYGSPAAAHQAVEAAAGLPAAQANFFGVFGPAEDRGNGATQKVARCLVAF